MSTIVGIDVAKAKLAIVLLTPDGKAWQKSCANTAAGHADLIRWLTRHAGPPGSWVGLEATGGYPQERSCWKSSCDLNDLSQNKLARDLDVPVARINDIIHARRGISADSALRLAAYFRTSAEFWLNLQSRYDLKVARRTVGEKIKKGIRPLPQQAA